MRWHRKPIAVSAKRELAAAIVASGQASPGEPKAIRRAMVRSAGALLVREAGGVVTDLSGDRWTAASPDFLAAPPALAPAMLAVLSSTPEYDA